MRSRQAQAIRAIAQDRLDVIRFSEGRWDFVSSLKSLNEETAHEYENRFAFELLQNAYDVQPEGESAGCVTFILSVSDADETALYVANTGKPFQLPNVEALTNLAQSTKPPGEGIGNKGLGFRSVLQLCDWPEIYSTGPDGSLETGYSFAFAREEDLRALAADETEFARLRRSVHPSLLPAPIEQPDETVRELVAAGHVTVIRLPLRDERALTVAMSRLEALRGEDCPVLLFLDRLKRVEVCYRGVEGANFVLHRSIEDPDIDLGNDIRASLVDVRKKKYVTLTRSIDSRVVQEAIASDVQAGYLADAWLEWEGRAEVSVALETGSEPVAGSFYTYLPTEEAAPLPGQVNAPFYTKVGRTHLSFETALNKALLSGIASLCVDAAVGMTDHDGIWRCAYADLLSWHGQHSQALREALCGVDATRLTGPSLTPRGKGWTALVEIKAWPSEVGDRFFSPAALAQRKALVPLDPDLGPERINRFGEACRAVLGVDLKLDDDHVGAVAEQVATAVQRRGIRPRELNTFYSELAQVADYFGTSPLERRRILLDQSGRLRRAGPFDDAAEKPVFLPPMAVDSASEERAVQLPSSLADAAAFLHPAVDLLESTRRSRTEIAEMLRKGGLAKAYDTEQVARALAAAAQRARSDRKRWDVLLFLLDLYQAVPRARRLFSGLRVPVPAEAGWIDAADAVFGSGWSAVGDLLSVFLERAVLPELMPLSDSRVLPPAAWRTPPGDLNLTVEFLRALGVREGLQPVPAEQGKVEGWGQRWWQPAWVADHLTLDERTRSWWLAATSVASRPEHPQTPYRQEGPAWTLPGQGKLLDLSTDARVLLSELLINSMPSWPSDAMIYRFERFQSHHRSKPDTQRWPSPLAAFLREAEWLPVSEPGRREVPVMVAPRDAWHFDDTSGQAPSYLWLVMLRVRRHLQQNPTSLRKLTHLGLDTWNDPATGRLRLHQLAALVEDGSLRDSDVDAVKKAIRQAWHDTLERDQPLDAPIVVQAEHVLRHASEDEPLYLPQDPPGYVQRLLEALGRPSVVIDAADGLRLAQLLDPAANRLRSMDSLQVDVRLDGRSLSELAPTDLVPMPDWVAEWVLLCAELTRNSMIRLGPAAIDRLVTEARQARVAIGRRVTLLINEEAIPLPSHLSGCVPVQEEAERILVAESPTDELSWPLLVNASEAMAELLGREPLATDLRLAATELRGILAHDWRSPTSDEWASAFREPTGRVQEVLAAARSTVTRTRDMIAPFLAVLVDEPTALEFRNTEADSVEALHTKLAAALSPDRADELIDIAENAPDLTTVRQALNISFGDLNRALRRLGPPYAPLHDPAEHRRVHEWFLNAHREQVQEAVRAGFLTEFDTRRSLASYVALREGPDLEATQEDLDEYESPPPDVIQQRLDDWLKANGCEPLGATLEGLPSIAQVRMHNRALAERLAAPLHRTFAAWLQAQPGAPFTTQEITDLPSLLYRRGWSDFRPLTEETVIDLLRDARLWPADLPLELASPDADGPSEGPQAEGQDPASPASTKTSYVSIDATEVDASDLAAVREAVMGTLDESFLAKGKRLARLSARDVTSPAGRRSDSRPGGSEGGTGTTAHQTDAQRTAIGFAGELLAYHWVRHQYPDSDERSWVSENRVHYLGGPGDDTVGYDLIVHQRSQTIRFEVKATTTDKLEFEMSDKEIYVAQQATRQQPYRILFVRRVLEPQHRGLLVLPNPFDATGAHTYTMAGRGLRLMFTPAP